MKSARLLLCLAVLLARGDALAQSNAGRQAVSALGRLEPEHGIIEVGVSSSPEAVSGSIVAELLVDLESGHITHMVLEKGHLFGKKEITVPVSAIDYAYADTVHLKLDKKAVSAERMSSAVLTIGLPTPPVLAVITGRAVALTTCTVPATSSPQTMARTG